jgi:hypothetical protein
MTGFTQHDTCSSLQKEFQIIPFQRGGAAGRQHARGGIFHSTTHFKGEHNQILGVSVYAK